MAVAVLIAAVTGSVWWWFGGRGATALPAERPAKHKVEKPKAEKPAKPKAEKPRTAGVQQQGAEVALRKTYDYWLKANASLKSMGIYELPLPDALQAYQAGLSLDE